MSAPRKSPPPGWIEDATDLMSEADRPVFKDVDPLAVIDLLKAGRLEEARTLAGDHPTALGLIRQWEREHA
jgi:hypothetical protein